jgi:hypothetical protein
MVASAAAAVKENEGGIYAPLWNALFHGDTRRVEKRCIPHTRVFDQITPFNNFDGAAKFPAEFEPTAAAISCCFPSASMDIEGPDNVSYNIAIRYAVVRDPNSRTFVTFNGSAHNFIQVTGNLIKRRIVLFVRFATWFLEFNKYDPR